MLFLKSFETLTHKLNSPSVKSTAVLWLNKEFTSCTVNSSPSSSYFLFYYIAYLFLNLNRQRNGQLWNEVHDEISYNNSRQPTKLLPVYSDNKLTIIYIPISTFHCSSCLFKPLHLITEIHCSHQHHLLQKNKKFLPELENSQNVQLAPAIFSFSLAQTSTKHLCFAVVKALSSC